MPKYIQTTSPAGSVGLKAYIPSLRLPCPQESASKGPFWCLLLRPIRISNIQLITSCLTCYCKASWGTHPFEFTSLHMNEREMGKTPSMTFFPTWRGPGHTGDSQTTHSTVPPPRSRHTALSLCGGSMSPKQREAMEPACCTVCLSTLLLHPLICNNHFHLPTA